MTGTVHDETIEVTVARTLDQVVMAMTLRGVIYLGEQHAPYTEEYDGNDLVGASHLIAWRGREPVGVLRLRWFADFAKVERAAVLKQYRRFGVMRALMQEALRYSARRGLPQGDRSRPGRACEVLAHPWLPGPCGPAEIPVFGLCLCRDRAGARTARERDHG